MALNTAKDRPLSLEERGVVGEHAVHSDEKLPVTEADVRPASATPEVDTSQLGAFRADFEKAPDPADAEEPQLPEGFEDWAAFKLANSGAKDSFISVVIFPGHQFTAPGRYTDAKTATKIYDVAERQIVPDGLFLFPVNYLVSGARRDAILRGEQPQERAAKQPDPLRPTKSKE